MLQGISIRKLLIIIASLLVIGFAIPDNVRGFETSFDQAVVVSHEPKLVVPSSPTVTADLISAPLKGFSPSHASVSPSAPPTGALGCVMRC